MFTGLKVKWREDDFILSGVDLNINTPPRGHDSKSVFSSAKSFFFRHHT